MNRARFLCALSITNSLGYKRTNTLLLFIPVIAWKGFFYFFQPSMLFRYISKLLLIHQHSFICRPPTRWFNTALFYYFLSLTLSLSPFSESRLLLLSLLFVISPIRGYVSQRLSNCYWENVPNTTISPG